LITKSYQIQPSIGWYQTYNSLWCSDLIMNLWKESLNSGG